MNKKIMSMQLTFLGATHTVTGSKYLITYNDKKILVDCGLYQGYRELRERNWQPLPVAPKDIDAIILTHAHIDHTGYIPLMVKNGFTGKIYCSYGTQDLCALLLPDSGHLQEEDAMHANKHGYSRHHPALPLYTREDAQRSLEQFYPLNFKQPFKLFDDLTVELFPAGHIIGSSLVYLSWQEKSLLFTGDLGRPHDPLTKPPSIMINADYIVTESTYGDRLHGQENPLDQLAEVIQKTAKRGGTVVIPAFAVGRTQDILYYLYMLKKDRRIPDLPVFLDSPMAQDVSDLLSKYADEHRLPKDLCAAICKVAKYTRTPDESKALDQSKMPSIIISASGMMEGGRILHHLKIFLPNPLNTVLLTGYQSGGTRGEQLQHGVADIKIHGVDVPVKAEIRVMHNMSAHADYQELLAWLKNFKSAPKKVFITHGEAASAEALKTKIATELHWDCVVPEYLQTVELI